MATMSGRTALVTGASAGIGRAIAKQLAAEGVEVIVHGRNARRGEEVVDEIVAAGDRLASSAPTSPTAVMSNGWPGRPETSTSSSTMPASISSCRRQR
jgi:NAD(P)-dependent dehydrogenase (short-subunit alcohol dehydrogenase family)